MNFTIPDTAKVKTLHITQLDKGLNLAENTHNSDINGLSDCKNVWFNNGVLKSRPGLYTTPENFINDEFYRDGFFYHFCPDDTEITIDGELKKIVVEEIEYDDSAYICLIHLINSDGVAENCSELIFNRTSGSTFYIPEKILFYKGAPQTGGGLFALVSLVNMENFGQHTYKIYEVDSDFSAWNIVTGYYIPTVYINGRGNKYEIAESTNVAFTGTPTRLENLNLLNGTFYAYFSSDGRSNSFRLPFSNIADENVICRIHHTAKDYVQWTIPSGSTTASATFLGTKVTMHVNREKGIIHFTVDAGDYEVPLMSQHSENNMEILATKHSEYGFTDIIKSTLAVSHNSKILLANKNTVFEASYENPLYFPKDSVINIGESDSDITAFSSLENSLIAFKPNATYRIGIKGGKALNSISLLANNDAIFYANDTLSADCLSRETGCSDKNSLIRRENELLWKGTDGYIYSIPSAKGKVACVSQKVNSYLKDNVNSPSKTFGVAFEDYNIFITDKTALVMHCNQNDTAWYTWEFTGDFTVLGAFNILNKPWLLCCNTSDDISFLATFKGDADTFLYGSAYNPTVSDSPVKSFVRTNKISFGCETGFKKIDKVFLNINTKKATIRLNDRLEAVICRHADEDECKSVKITPGLCGINFLDITVESDTGFSLKSIDIKYTELNL